ncbi:MAG: shikimate kinase [Gemmatimonadales bacterium]
MKRHIVLVGLPGCGKSTVGALVAEQLGAEFIDLDTAITRQMQMPVARIFGEFGEPRFREAEREAMRKALEGPPAVIAPGAGWAAQEGEMERARNQSFIIYLKTLVTTALDRSPEGIRPLLAGEDSAGRMRNLLSEREPWYNQADREVKNDHRPPEVAAEAIVNAARREAGW